VVVTTLTFAKPGAPGPRTSLLGRAGNNPYCHHRVLELAKQGLRERIAQVEKAPGTSFDHGRFELMLESVDGTSVVDSVPANGTSLVQITSGRNLSPNEVQLQEI
jgi:hypothetical protein